MSDYITVRQACDILARAGCPYNPVYFRIKFLEPGHELLPLAPQPPGDRQRRRLLILRSAVLAMIKQTA